MDEALKDAHNYFEIVGENDERYDAVYLHLLSKASRKIDCMLHNISTLERQHIKALMEFLGGSEKRKDLQMRFIMNITKDNFAVVKQLMKYSDLYHVEGIVGSSYIVDDNTYLYDVQNMDQKDEPYHQLFYSTHPGFVKMHQFLFDNLLSKAVPAKEKIKEIERGGQREFIETIQDPSSTLELVKSLVSSASFEILVLFSTMNSFYRAESDGILDLLGEASGRGLNVRVLVKIEDEVMKDASKQKIKQKHEKISVNFIEKSVKSRITTFVVDQTYSLAMEVTDDSKENFDMATGLSTYSNSESTVFTYYSMFENLWIQAELERQGKVKQAYFRMLKGQKLKDEIYDKRWALGEDSP